MSSSLANFAIATTFVFGKFNISLNILPHVSTWVFLRPPQARSSWKAAVRPVLELHNT